MSGTTESTARMANASKSDASRFARAGTGLAATAVGALTILFAWMLFSDRIVALDASMDRTIAIVFAAVAAAACLLAGLQLRVRLREAGHVMDALRAYADGERDLGSLRVGASGEPGAAGFNALLDTCRDARTADLAERAEEMLSSRKSVDDGLAEAVQALWQGCRAARRRSHRPPYQSGRRRRARHGAGYRLDVARAADR